ncbi:MAG: S1 RNA-binding domain-containing protein, partial [Nitrospinaceae bacterium]
IKQLEPDPWSAVEQKYPIGSVQEGRVRNLTAFGAFVELEEGIDGLVHISQVCDRRIRSVTDEIQEGDEIKVKVIDVDSQGKVKLSRKEALRQEAGVV